MTKEACQSKRRVRNGRYVCSIEGCENDARSKFGAWCEKHYYRNRRKRSFDDPEVKGRLKTEHGYIIVRSNDHPVSHSSGMAYEHRVVLYDSVNGEDQPCHWCKKDLVWFGDGEKIVVDHLDNNKENNDGSNLVPSCHKCNSMRGLFMKWVLHHKDDPFLIEIFDKSNTALMECR